MRLTRRYRFAASHRLHTPALSEEENRKLYGKCNNPYGHGHDYVMDVTVEGPVDGAGHVVDRDAFDNLVRERVLKELDHKNLNEDRPEFQARVATTENLAHVVRGLLAKEWKLGAKLKTIRISETDRNTFTLQVGEGQE
jgi:6-pyruvoyltetrahydropterin/6-carboxytetrahydropterin synthase